MNTLGRSKQAKIKKLIKTQNQYPQKQKGYRQRLRAVYDNDLEQFQRYDEVYCIASRLGLTVEEAWEANPVISGSTYPEDLRIVAL
jgi:hypothetical protein